MSRTIRTALFAAAALALTPGLAQAACNSAPVEAAAPDLATDGGQLAPEITSLRASVDGLCNATFSYDIAGQTSLLPTEALTWFVDVDGKNNTGATSGYPGADYAIARVDVGNAVLTAYDPASASFQAVGEIPAAGAFGATLDLPRTITMGNGPMYVAGASMWTSTDSGTTYLDAAPDPGSPFLAFNVNMWDPATAAAPAPAPAPSTYWEGTEDECYVPNVRRMRTTSAKRAIRNSGCRIGSIRYRSSYSVKAGRVISTSRRAGSSHFYGAKVGLVVSVGRPARRWSTGAESHTTKVVDRLNAALDATK